ncbi:helix-turn-helix domain-containing protein [Sphaerisporangium fuscum]|uniref:helix-turn-helix domain-containing protein n=1 Tax=Sphaerisporangium fuscum TaxID=2835868 RepID=UPI001BDD6657|nr:helix-turn-helix transcriptional regulator [Sphaerisporangium fuscum]
MSPKREIDPNESPRALFAAELRRYRQAAGLTQRALGARMSFSDSQVAMVESLRRAPTEEFARECDKALRLDGTMTGLYLATLWKHAQEHIRPFLEEEQEATGLRSWEPALVPGLLQTEAYARTVIAASPGITPEEVDERLKNRMQRQGLLRRENPPLISAIMDEAVIRRVIGDAVVMNEQLRRLLEVAQHPKVTIQIVPYGIPAHCGMMGGFIIAERNGVPQAAYVEGQPNGRTVDDRATINRLMLRYDAVRAEALSFRQSLKLIEEVVNGCVS